MARRDVRPTPEPPWIRRPPMNREQVGVCAVAALAVLTLSVSASALAGQDGGSKGAMGGTSVFTEDATLEDDLNPQDQDLSGSPFLEMLYEVTPGLNEETNTTDPSAERGGKTSLLPLAVLFGGLMVAASILAVVGIWRLWRASRPDGATTEVTERRRNDPGADEPDEPDRVDPDALDNDVYRAWYRMAREVGGDRRSSDTPREVARLAVEDGMDSDAVETLTRQFEAVRYGDAGVTADRARSVDEAYSRLGIEGERP